MKYLSLTCLLALLTGLQSVAGVVILEGQYQEKNVYVANSIGESGVGFCTYEVRVNGEITADELNSSAFEIDLSVHALGVGQSVFIEIKYKEGCSPKVLNPGVLKPQPTFNTESIVVDNEGVVKWSTNGEKGELPYYVQIYKWNKWVTVGEVKGSGESGAHDYGFKLDLVSGKNTVRVFQRGYDKNVKYSPAAKVMGKDPKVTFEYNKGNKSIEFSRETAYEVYDKFGQITKKGFGEEIDMSNMKKEEYYISYDNATDEFKKR
jgi:hypothetical protein